MPITNFDASFQTPAADWFPFACFSPAGLINFLVLSPLCHSPGIPGKFNAAFIITAPTAA